MFLVLVAGGELDDVALGLARAVRDEDADFTTVIRIVLALRLGRQRADETGPSLVAVHTEGFPVLFAQHPLWLGRLRGQTRKHDHCGGHTHDKEVARHFHVPTKFLSALTFLSCSHNRVSACGSWRECEIRRQCKTPSGVMQRILGCLQPSCPDAPADG